MSARSSGSTAAAAPASSPSPVAASSLLRQISKSTRVITTPAPKKQAPPAEPLNRLLYGKDLSEYANIPIDELLSQLTEEELEELGNEIDPDDPHVPPSMRCKEQTKKAATGPLDRKKLLSYLKKYAMEQEDWPENKPYEAGAKRGERQAACASRLSPETSGLFIPLVI